MEKKILIVCDIDADMEPMTALLVDASLDLEKAQEEINCAIEAESELYPGEWMVDGVIERLTFPFEELPINIVTM